LSGVICTLIFFDAERSDSNRRRFTEAAALAAVLALVAWLLRPLFGISKIYATPSWCLYCAAICVVLFAALYALIDVHHLGRWIRWVEPAASSPLVTYLIPFVVVSLLALAGWSVPAVLRDGWIGLDHTPESVLEPIKKLGVLRGDGPPIEITIGGAIQSPDDVARFAEAGVDRLLVSPWPRSPEAIEGLRRFADTIGIA
jgi:hypothetical protein